MALDMLQFFASSWTSVPCSMLPRDGNQAPEHFSKLFLSASKPLQASSGVEGGQPTLSLAEDGCFDPYGLFMVGQRFSW